MERLFTIGLIAYLLGTSFSVFYGFACEITLSLSSLALSCCNLSI